MSSLLGIAAPIY